MKGCGSSFGSSSRKPTSLHNFSLHRVIIALISILIHSLFRHQQERFIVPSRRVIALSSADKTFKLTLQRRRFVSLHENKDDKVSGGGIEAAVIVIFAPPASPAGRQSVFVYVKYDILLL